MVPPFTVRTTPELAAQVRAEARRRDMHVVDLWREMANEYFERRREDRLSVVEGRVDRIDAYLGIDSTRTA